MTILEKLISWRPAPLPKGREFEKPPRWDGSPNGGAGLRARPDTLGQDAGTETRATTRIICPRCESRVELEPYVCERCGFPFICDTAPVDRVAVEKKRTAWRTLLAIGVLVFWVSNAVFVAAGSDSYQGRGSAVVAHLTPDTASGIPISGPGSFQKRTQLALGLLKERAPQFYYRMTQGVTSIDFLDHALVDEHTGRRISLEGIGALSTPDTGQVEVLISTAFPSGLDELTDGDVFTYAGVLVHELRHIELHKAGAAPGGWEEEVLCEQAAYAAEQAMDAPGVILTRYEMYLHDPHARQFQPWYDWYKQFER